MSNYTQVQEALSAGVEPALICSTCPWDRFCITPPEMTKSDIEKHMRDAEAKDKEIADKAAAEGKSAGMGSIMTSLMTTMMFAGRDTQASTCPVLVARMRSSDGRKIVDGVRKQMQSWNDADVGSLT